MALIPLTARAGIAAGGAGRIRTFPVSMERTTKTRRLGIAAALITTPFMGLPAWGAACEPAPVSTYTAPGFSCDVFGVVQFSNVSFSATVSNGGTIDLLPQAAISGFFQIIPEFPADTVFGLVLSYDAKANFPTSTAALSLSYNVPGLAGKPSR